MLKMYVMFLINEIWDNYLLLIPQI